MNDIPRWYAIHTHPKQESRAEGNLKAWDVETFLPKIKDSRINECTGMRTNSIKPLFPRYLRPFRIRQFILKSSLHQRRA
jgi:hypothetical protein